MKVQRCRVTDAISRDGETAVLVHGHLVRLSELSSVIWAMTQEPVEVAALSSALEARFGTPDGDTVLSATQDAVAHLVRHGVLRTAG